MKPREVAECEVYRDLKKSTKHLLVDVYEELLKKYDTFDENIIHANKRMSALTARSIIATNKTNNLLVVLTVVIAVLTMVLVLKTVFL